MVILTLLTAVGALGSFLGAIWLYRINPSDPRFEQGGVRYLGPNQRTPVPDLIRAQRTPALVIVLSTGAQFLVGCAASVVALAS